MNRKTHESDNKATTVAMRIRSGVKAGIVRTVKTTGAKR